MKWKHGQKGAKAQQQQEEGKNLEALAKMSCLGSCSQGLHIKGTGLRRKGLEIQCHHTHQHKGRAHEQEDGQLHAGIFLGDPLGGAPDNYHNIDRYDHYLIAQQEDKQIRSNKGACYTGDKNHQKDIEILGPLRNAPGAKHRSQANKLRQKQHRQGYTIHT